VSTGDQSGDAAEKPHGELTLRTMAMPADTNAAGDIFGGWVLSQMDLAGGIAAGQRAGGRVVTIAVDKMKFIRPVHVGDVLCIYSHVGRVGRSSMEITLEAWALRHRFGHREKVTQAMFTMVAVDDEGRPQAVPKVAPVEGEPTGT
jgi:acyl-CoA thioesterase YciA